jgi:hypothetical protein
MASLWTRLRANWLALSVVLVVVAFWINAHYYPARRMATERFQDVAALMNNLTTASKKFGDAKSYPLWLGYLYKNPGDSTKALNDIKQRFFDPTCQFNPDWTKTTKERPIGATSAQEANEAYKAFTNCVATGEYVCMNQLDDMRVRLFGPNCTFLVQRDETNYTNNLGPVFS